MPSLAYRVIKLQGPHGSAAGRIAAATIRMCALQIPSEVLHPDLRPRVAGSTGA